MIEVIYIYYIGISLILFYTGYRMWKEFKVSSNIQGRLFGLILWAWLAMVFFYQFPNVRQSDLELKKNYQDTTYLTRDKMQEKTLVYLISGSIRNIPDIYQDEKILIFLSPQETEQLNWMDAEYLQWRLKYRNYPIQLEFAFISPDGKYHDYYDLLVRNRPGFESLSAQDKILDFESIHQNKYILYIGANQKDIPAGFEIISRDTIFSVLKKKES